jgi:hypothetical protein
VRGLQSWLPLPRERVGVRGLQSKRSVSVRARVEVHPGPRGSKNARPDTPCLPAAAFAGHRKPPVITVLSAIGFDDQSGFQACKVHNSGFNHHLAAEPVSHQTACPQMSPPYAFRIAGLAAKGTQVDSLSLSLSLGRERGLFIRAE